MNRLWLFLIGVILIAAVSCGGGGSAQTPAATNSGGPAATTPAPEDTSSTLSAELMRLDAMGPPAGVEPEVWLTLKASMREAMIALLPDKVTQAPPAGEHNAITNLAFARDEEEVGWLTWSFSHYADYDLNGVVDADDVVPLGEHYRELVGEETPIAARLDTSGNGVVDIADVTAIAQHYGSVLAGFSMRAYVSETEFSELGPVARDAAINLETPEFAVDGVLRYQFGYDGTEWVDLAVAAVDGEGLAGDQSNAVQFQPPRIVSVSVPSGKVGDTGTARAVVEGAEPITYEWILTNGLSPTRSSEPEAAVELVRQGMFNGRLNVSNIFGSATQSFAVTIGVPPTISAVSPDTAVHGQRVEFSTTAAGTQPLAYSWNFGPNAFPQTSVLERPLVEFDTDGTHDCSLMVTNAHGNAAHDFSVTVGSAPSIFGVTPAQGTRGTSVRFRGEVLGTQPFSYFWTFTGVGDPLSSMEAEPLVSLDSVGSHQCKLVVSNVYGEATDWFTVYVGRAPNIDLVFWTSTTGGNLCWYFANVTGDFPMTWTWTFFDIFAPSPPYVVEGIPVVLLLPSYTGVFNCQLEAVNDFGSDVFEFEYEVTEVPPPPM